MANHVRLYVNNKPVELIRSVVERNGTRAVDTGVFTLGRKYAVTKGDTFQYLQDVISPKYLVGLWNMENNTRDESGYDIDGDETTAGIHQGAFVKDANGYAYKNDSLNTGRCIKIAHDSHLDFSSVFDIVILGGEYNGTPTSYTGYLLGKGTSTISIEIKITSGSNASDPMYVVADLKIGGSTTTLTGTTDMNKTNGNYGSGEMENYRWIRLKRDSKNLVTLMVGDNVEDTDTVSGDFTTTEPLYIAGNRSGGNTLHVNQRTAQVRVYSGYNIPDDQWGVLMSARRPTQVMKFGGTVWKIDEKITHKICHCKGLSDKLHNITINTGNTTYPTWTTGDSDIIKNEYFDKTGEEILTDIISVYNVGLNVATLGYLDTEYEHYSALGSLLDNINLLQFADGSSDISFHITPRGTLILEKSDLSHDEIKFRQSSLSRFSNFGYDDTSLVTQITLVGQASTLSQTKKVQGGDFATSITSGHGYAQTSGTSFGGFPITASVTDPNGVELVNIHEKSNYYGGNNEINAVLWNRVVDSSGNNVAAGTGEFKVDYHTRKIYLGDNPNGSSSYWTVKGTYQDTTNPRVYWTQKYSTYTTLGAYSKTWHIPHFSGTYNLASIADRVFARLGLLERRVTITIPTLVNHIRENYEVKVEDPDHLVGTAGSPISLSVKSMKFLYPEGQTIINCGEHMFDSFDLDKAFSEAHSQQKSNIITTPA